MLLVRYFAGARAAAGVPEEKVEAQTLGDLVATLTADRPRLAGVVSACSFLVDGTSWRDRHADVVAGLAAAAEAGLGPVKMNAVLLRGVNDDEAVRLLEFALERGYELRFIEQMPLDAGHTWSRAEMVTAEEILAALEAEFTLLPDPAERGGAPAQTWLVAGYPGPPKVGVIASVTRPFCAACDRTRLTADGQVRTCLFSRDETDLRGLLRSGGSDDELATAWARAMFGKAAGHGIDDPAFLQPARPMSAIGG